MIRNREREKEERRHSGKSAENGVNVLVRYFVRREDDLVLVVMTGQRRSAGLKAWYSLQGAASAVQRTSFSVLTQGVSGDQEKQTTAR